jgi:dihydrofolate synthase/folylpolyglutamate synthase
VLSVGRGATPGDPLTSLLQSRPITAVAWGLERTRALLAELEHPETAFDSIHIAGTNGKGSTAAFAAAILAAHGARVGRYASPHLEDVRERFRLGEDAVPEPVLQAAAERVAACPASGEATYFEAATALAFESFRSAAVTWAVVETGLGGRLDATNVLTPRVSAITNIGMDHVSLLGDTIESIAAEKAGILKPGVPAVAGVLAREARAVVEERAELLGVPLRLVGVDAVLGDVSIGAEGTRFRLTSSTFPGGRGLHTRLLGEHQAENAALAVLALETAGIELRGDLVAAGIASASMPGRYEVIEIDGERWVLDMGHNREALAATLAAFEAIERRSPRVALVGILTDKPWRQMLEMLLVRMDAIILTRPPSAPQQRQWDPEASARALAKHGEPAVSAVNDFDRALDRARVLAGDGVTLVTGSAHTAGDARTRLLARRAR